MTYYINFCNFCAKKCGFKKIIHFLCESLWSTQSHPSGVCSSLSTGCNLLTSWPSRQPGWSRHRLQNHWRRYVPGAEEATWGQLQQGSLVGGALADAALGGELHISASLRPLQLDAVLCSSSTSF